MQLTKRRWADYVIGDRSFYKTVFTIVVPIIIQNLITSFVSLLDNIMVGQMGTAQMSGVAIANQLVFIFNICIFGGISGASIYGAQFYGAKDYEGMRACMRVKLYIGVGISVIIGAAFMLFDEQLISLFLQSSDGADVIKATLAAGQEYLWIMLLGLLPFALAQMYSSTLREAGVTMLPMISGVVAVITNMVFNYILIFGKFGAPALGVKGAAIATVISRYVELAIVVICVHVNANRYFYIKGVYRTLKVPMLLIKRIAVRGTPLLANEALWSVGRSFLNQLYSVAGIDVVAASNIASTVSNLFNTVAFAMGNAVAIMVGQALGADDIDRAKKTAWRLIVFGVASAVCMGLLLAGSSPFIPLIYKTEQSVRDLATTFMLILAGTMPLTAFAHCCYFTLRSGGKTVITFIFDCMSVWVINVPVVYFAVHHTDLSIGWVYALSQLVNLIKCIFGFILVKKGIWIHNITVETRKMA
ncbi:MAG: MATE family efflux transporter [Clostridia bacterium]|nr:MATE family efflux transporter [Clostridia bacterium]